MAHAQVVGEVPLEALELGAEDERPAIEHRGDPGVERPTQGRERGGQVKQRNGHLTAEDSSGDLSPHTQIPSLP